MAKKRRRRRPSLITKGINLGILLLAFSRPLQLAASGGVQNLGKQLAFEATAGMSEGRFDKSALLRFYGPMLGAIILKKAISMVRRTAHV